MTTTDPHHASNVDPRETEHFSKLAASWWDPAGESRALHLINPVRLNYLRERLDLTDAAVLDVGCGAGLLSEAMATAGARVSAIDASEQLIRVARLHLHESGLTVDYQLASAEYWADRHAGEYALITCMELIEHVPDPASLVAACARLLQPAGRLVLSTLNRTPKAWLQAVVGAEYLLGLLPRGTHDYRKFVRPSELEYWGRQHGLQLLDLRGMLFNPVNQQARLGESVAVNYLADFVKE